MMFPDLVLTQPRSVSRLSQAYRKWSELNPSATADFISSGSSASAHLEYPWSLAELS